MRFFKHSIVTLAVLATSSALLMGCKEEPKPEASPSAAVTGSDKSAPASSVSSKQDQAAALNAYITSYNRMHGTQVSGLEKEYQRYKALKVASNAPRSGHFNSDYSDVEGYTRNIKNVRSAGKASGDAQLDSAADAVVAAGEQLIAVQKPLNIYFKSKGYLEDSWAQAKANDAAMVAAYDAMVNSFKQLGVELDRVQKLRRQENIAEYKAAGDVLRASMLTSMDLAQTLVDGIDPERLKDPTLIAHLDEVSQQLQASLEEMGKALEAEEQKTGQSPKGGFSSISRNLSSMLGAWREFKRTPSDTRYESIIRDYNRAVESMNRDF